jgi:hypothetical protein
MTEAQLHKAVARYLWLALKPPVLWSTFPAGGGGIRRGARLKERGLKAGMPDILVFAPGIVLGVELKTGKGSLSPEQKAMRDAFLALGMHWATCRSLYDVAKALSDYSVPRTQPFEVRP